MPAQLLNPTPIDRRHHTEPVTQAAPAAHWPELDGLRTLAFLMVFGVHCRTVIDFSGNFWLDRFTDKLIIGVDLFFVLSGFLITTLLLRECQKFGSASLQLFYVRRGLRIWPLYYLAVIASCIVLPLWAGIMQQKVFDYGAFLRTVALPLSLFLGNFALITNSVTCRELGLLIKIPVDRLILPLWSLGVEEQFYLGWPWLINLLKKPAAVLKAALITALTVDLLRIFFWHQSVPSHNTYLWYYNSFANFDGLMLGASAAVIYRCHPKMIEALRRNGALVLATIVLGYLGFAFAVPEFSANSLTFVLTLPFVHLLCAALLLLTLCWQPLKTAFSASVLSRTGQYTYACYIFHFMVLGGLAPWCRDHLGTGIASRITVCVSALLVTYLVARLSWFLMEDRFQRMRKHFSRA